MIRKHFFSALILADLSGALDRKLLGDLVKDLLEFV